MAHIQQHMYTREREGVFNSTPGYDTIAISKGLDKTFIKNVLHPLCSYYPPRELASIGEKDEGKYPKSRLITFTESGELILGQSVYKESDYTGERETFFSHNFIVPRQGINEFLYSADAVFGRLPFENGYDVSKGKQLTEFEELPANLSEFQSLPSILTKLSITAEQFKQLIFAMISSLTSKKKVYISLPGEVCSVTEAAYQLTYYLFQCIPFELRKSFGFISYASEPQNKKNINLMFIEKGSIRPTDSLINKDFVFDFAQDIFLNSKENVNNHPFLQFAYNSLVSNPGKLTEFFTYAENALYDQKNITLQHYNDLQTLYSIVEGSYQASEVNNLAIFKILRQFLTAENFSKKEALSDTLVKLVDEELSIIKKNQTHSSVEMILELLYFSTFIDQEHRSKIVLYIAYSLYFGSSDIKYVSKIYTYLKAQPLLFKLVNSTILKQPNLVKSIIEPYVRAQLTAITSLKALVGEVKFWLHANPDIIDNPEFFETSKEMFVSLFKKEKDLIVTFHSLKKELVSPRVQDEGISYFYKSILKELATLVINGLVLETMTRDQFEQASTIGKSIAIDTSHGNVKSKLELIHHVNEVMESRQFADPERFSNNTNFGKLQLIILRLIQKSPIEEQIERIAFSFYNASHRSQNYNYTEMFRYVHSQGGTKAMAKFLYQFTRMWRGRNARDRGLEIALHDYIGEHSKEILKDKRSIRNWASIDRLVVKVLEQVKYEQMSAIGKFIHKNQKVLYMSLVSVLSLSIIGVGGYGIYDYLQDKKAEEVAQKRAIAEGKKINIIDPQFQHIEMDGIDGVSNLDLLEISSDKDISLKNKNTVEKLVLEINGEKFTIEKVSAKDIKTNEQKLNSINLTITDNNSKAVKDLIDKYQVETIKVKEIDFVPTSGNESNSENETSKEDDSEE
jgi:hypothetical protein